MPFPICLQPPVSRGLLPRHHNPQHLSRLNFILASEGFLLFSSPPRFSSSRGSMPYLKGASLLFCCLYITAPSDRHLSEPPGWQVGEFGHHKIKLGKTSPLAEDDALTGIEKNNKTLTNSHQSMMMQVNANYLQLLLIFFFSSTTATCTQLRAASYCVHACASALSLAGHLKGNWRVGGR